MDRVPPAPDFVASVLAPLSSQPAPLPASGGGGRSAALEATDPAAGPATDSPLGDAWTALVKRMVATEMVAALARELALQSELRSQVGGVWTLRVERESLNQAAAREKLQLALQAAVPDTGEVIKLVVELGPVSDSPARRNAAAHLERQRLAEATIHNDPLVQDMMRDWDAKIVPGSIKSLAPVTGKPI